MLNLRHRSRSAPPRSTVDGAGSDRPDLQIRSLLDDPQLRRAMGLEAPAVVRPEPRFDRRRLLDAAAA